MTMETNAGIPASDMDGGWKEIIEDLTEDFFKFYFPDIHAGINFTKGVMFLDKELNQIISDGDNIKREADKLLRVTLLDGRTQTLYIHVEVQGQRDPTFAKRMFVYNYRIYDKYNDDVMSLALLIDGDENFRPDTFSINHFGFKTTFKFPMVKLIDFDEEELKSERNPFAVATRVQLAKIRIRREDVTAVYNFKRELLKELGRMGYDRETGRKLLKFIDFVLTLSKNDDIKLKKEIEQYEETNNMPYVTSFERLAKEEGIREGVLEILEVRFTEVPYAIKEKINYCDDLKKLKKLHRQALTIKTIDELDA
jgi:hypothetical protein